MLTEIDINMSSHKMSDIKILSKNKLTKLGTSTFPKQAKTKKSSYKFKYYGEDFSKKQSKRYQTDI